MAVPTPPPVPAAPGRDWSDQAAEAIESVVLAVKDKTTIATTIARALVYGVVILALATTAGVLVVIAAVRLADVYLLGWAGRVHGRHRVWIAYLALGVLFSGSGLALWTRRTKKGGPA